MPHLPPAPAAGSLRRAIACLAALALALGSCIADQVEDTKFNADRGFYDAPFLLELSTATKGATLRYTVDGSQPSLTTGRTYTKPLLVSRTTVVRAAAFKDGLEPTDIDTQTYLFLDDVLRQTGEGWPVSWGELGNFDTEPFNLPPGPYAGDYAMDPDIVDHPIYSATIKDDMRSIPSLAISLHPDDLFSDTPVASVEGEVVETRGIYPIGKGFERAASAELILPDGSTGFQIDCSIEIQGATSTDRWKTDKLSMRLKFKAPYGPSELDYPLFGDDATDSINTVILDSTNQQSWTHPVPEQQLRAQYLRDQLVGDLQNAMGGIAPHGRYAHVYLDGLYWGMYWMHEFVEEGFVTAYRGGKADDYDILRHRADNVVAGSADSFAALLAATELDLSVPANYQDVADRLDIDAFADYMLCNFYSGNADWAFQNWNASAHRTDPERKWLFHNWDAEKTFQLVIDDNTDADNPGSPTAIHQNLLASDEYRIAFADRVRKHLFNGGVLTPASAIAAYQFRATMIDRAVVGESARWGDNRNPDDPPFTRATWLSERNRLLNFWFPGRTSVLLSQLNDDGLYPDTPAPDFSQHGGSVEAGFVLNITDSSGEGTVFYTTDGLDPRDPSAVASTSVTINSSIRVKARTKAPDGEFSALTEAVFLVANTLVDLRVTELMFNPGEPNPSEVLAGFDDADLFEFVELRNTGSSAIDLEGLRFSEGVDFTFGALILDVDERVLVVNDLAAFEQRYGSGLPVAGEYGGTLSNAGETITLLGPFGEAVQSFSFSDDLNAPADGAGRSLVVLAESVDPINWDDPGFWRSSTFVGGSPGSAELPTPNLIISELHYDPREPDSEEQAAGFTSEEQFEFIELINKNAAPIDLNGFQLSEAVEFTFGVHLLGVNQRAVVVANSAAFTERYGAGAATIVGEFSAGTLSNSGERLMLTGPLGELIHDFTYDDRWYPATDGIGASLVIADEEEEPATRDSREAWAASTFAGGSPGAAEPVASDSPLRITEIMFNPAAPTSGETFAGFDDSDDFEFIELTNTGEGPIQLLAHHFAEGVGFDFPSQILLPGEQIVLVKDEEAFNERYGANDAVIGEYAGSLRNDREQLELRDAADQIVLSFTYDDDWHDSTDGDGRSLTIIDPLSHRAYWGDEDGWRPSGAAAGSPGGAPDPYAAWIWTAFDDEDDALDPALNAAIADLDGDGIPNLLEYALGTDPLSSDNRGYFESVIELDGDLYLLFSFQMNAAASDVWYSVEFSSNGQNWTAADLGAQTLIEDVAPDGTPRLSMIDSTALPAGGTRLVRLKVERS